MHGLIWILALVVWAGWSLLAWAAGWVLGLDPSWISELATRVREWPLAPSLDLWLPGWDGPTAVALGGLHALMAGFGQAGVIVIWVVWGLGTVLIAGAAALASGLVHLVRRTTAPRPGSIQA